jgi:hypothetical protein
MAQVLHFLPPDHFAELGFCLDAQLDQRFPSEGELTSSPAVIQVTGDANRLYWIHAPRQLISEAEGAIVSPISVVSRNAGDVSTARLARMDAGGKDYLTVSGQMNIKGREGGPLSLLIPIRVVYE